MSNYQPPALRHEKLLDRPVAAAAVTPEINTDHKPRPKRRRKKKKSQGAWPVPPGPSEERQTGRPVVILGNTGRWSSPVDVSCAISECDSGIALDDDDDFGGSGGFVIEMMDPLDPRVALPVPERNVAPRDPGHDRLSWTVCYDDDCPVHLSEKNGSGWFPDGPGRSGWRDSRPS